MTMMMRRLGDVSADNDEFGKVMAGKQVIGRDDTIPHSTSQSKERSVACY